MMQKLREWIWMKFCMKNIGEEVNGHQCFVFTGKFILRIFKFKFLKTIDFISYLISYIPSKNYQK